MATATLGKESDTVTSVQLGVVADHISKEAVASMQESILDTFGVTQRETAAKARAVLIDRLGKIRSALSFNMQTAQALNVPNPEVAFNAIEAFIQGAEQQALKSTSNNNS